MKQRPISMRASAISEEVWRRRRVGHCRRCAGPRMKYFSSARARHERLLIELQTAEGKVHEILARAQQVEEKLSRVDQLTKEVKALTNKVDTIEENIRLVAPKQVSDEQKQTLKDSLAQFQVYMASVGYKSKWADITVEVQRRTKPGVISYYDPEKRRIYVERAALGILTVIFRQYSHHVLTEKLWAKPGGEQLPGIESYAGIESGLANYFCCSFKNNPLFATEAARVKHHDKPWFMKLDNQRKFKEVAHSRLFDDIGEVWGGAFWKSAHVWAVMLPTRSCLQPGTPLK